MDNVNSACIGMAGVPIRITCRFPSTIEYCRRYLCDKPPAVEVCVSREDIFRERELNRIYEEKKRRDIPERSRTDVPHGGGCGDKACQPDVLPRPDWSDAYLETLALYRKICDALIRHDILLFHGSAVSVDGEGYVFTAKSGTGKSTHAALWREALPPLGHSITMINDDKPLLRFDKDAIWVCGTPWNGRHHLGTNTMVRVHAIGKIIRSQDNHVEPLPGTQFWQMALSQTYLPEDPELAGHGLELLQRLYEEIPLYYVFCNMEPEAAVVSWQGLSGAEVVGKPTV